PSLSLFHLEVSVTHVLLGLISGSRHYLPITACYSIPLVLLKGLAACWPRGRCRSRPRAVGVRGRDGREPRIIRVGLPDGRVRGDGWLVADTWSHAVCIGIRVVA